MSTAPGFQSAVDEDGLPCMLIRGGTSKGAYFLAGDLPAERAERDGLLLRVMGSPDPRQIDGIGGAHPLTSKVAVVSRSGDPNADVDYLFLQVGVDEAVVSDAQNCGNLLAGVGPFALERGLVKAGGAETQVRIRMVNTGQFATATIQTPGGRVRYAGDASLPGVPGTAAPIVLEFGAPDKLLPTGQVADILDGTQATCVDAGMPVVLLDAAGFGVSGRETPAELEANAKLTARIARIRLAALALMGLDPGTAATIPKLALIAPPHDGGTVSTRTFIPVRCHTALGALAGVSISVGLQLEGAVGRDSAQLPPAGKPLRLEHPTGHLDVAVDLDTSVQPPLLRRAGVVRTARKLFDGTVYPGPARSV
jgi:4-oxalomesaconate tautomerase